MYLARKPQCILHIGMHKTGSSSIQATLCSEPPKLDFEYVSLSPDGNNSQAIYSLFSEHPEHYHGNKKLGFTEHELLNINQNNLEKLTTTLKNTQAKQVIISAEDISALNEVELKRLKQYLLKYCQTIQVIGYVRPFVSYMQSALQQVIKDGLKKFTLDNLYPNYRKTFEKFDNVFGKGHVQLIQFDASTLLGKNVVLDFCQRIGITINGESVIRENESISLEAASLLYTYHQFGFGFGSGNKVFNENSLLIKAVSAIGNKKIKFSSDLIHELQEKYSEDIQWIENRLGSEFKYHRENATDGINSEKDLLNLSLDYSDELKQLIGAQLQQEEATPQKIADWMHLLRVQLSNQNEDQTSLICSVAQLEQSITTAKQLSQSLKSIFLELSHADNQETVISLRRKILPLLRLGTEPFNAKDDIAFSIDLYQDNCLMGWILDKSAPFRRLNIEFHSMHGIIGKGVADIFRVDLAGTISEDGCCAFKIPIDPTIDELGDLIAIRVLDYNKFFYFKGDLSKY